MIQNLSLEVEDKDVLIISELKEAKKFMMSYTNGFKGIPDPSEWQREIRQDRPLPGRE
jgi:hypothetical protein